MTLTPIKTPLLAKRMFPNYIWDISTNDNILYLTFDDGPTPEITDWVLNTLKQYQAKATFFCIGNNIDKHPDIFQNIIKDGHRIGNHTYNHVKGWKTKTKDYLKNIEKCETVLNEHISKSSVINHKSDLSKATRSPIVNLFRPPYGKIKLKQGKQLLALGYSIVMWDILSFDWDNKISQENCLNNIVSKAKPGSIIVFHDSLKASKNMMHALPKTLEHFSKLGYTFKALP